MMLLSLIVMCQGGEADLHDKFKCMSTLSLFHTEVPARVRDQLHDADQRLPAVLRGKKCGLYAVLSRELSILCPLL